MRGKNIDDLGRCIIWMICLKLNKLFYVSSHILHISEIVWTLRSSI